MDLPAEIWGLVYEYLQNVNRWKSELQALRLVNRKLENEASRLLFASVKISHRTQQFHNFLKLLTDGRNGREVRRYVRHVHFDITALWSIRPRSSGESVQESQCQIECIGSCHGGHSTVSGEYIYFSCPSLYRKFGQLTNLETVTISPEGFHGYSVGLNSLELPHVSSETAFIQVFRLLSKLEQPLQTLIIKSGRQKPIFLTLFGRSLGFYKGYTPFTNRSLLDLQTSLSLDIDRNMKIFAGLEMLDLDLYSANPTHLPSHRQFRSHWLRDALAVMAPKLKHLYLRISYFEQCAANVLRDTCQEDGGATLTNHLTLCASGLCFICLVPDFRFPRLQNFVLENMAFDAESLGKFLRKHAGSLRSLKAKFWSCRPSMPTVRTIQMLAENAGPSSLSLLELAQSPNHRRSLCSKARSVDEKRLYWEINAADLHRLYETEMWYTDDAILALAYEVPIEIHLYPDSNRSWRDDGRAETHYELALRIRVQKVSELSHTPTASLVNLGCLKARLLDVWAREERQSAGLTVDPDETLCDWYQKKPECFVFKGTAEHEACLIQRCYAPEGPRWLAYINRVWTKSDVVEQLDPSTIYGYFGD
jgi:hypothetical protein